jgi:hypothetical protein
MEGPPQIRREVRIKSLNRLERGSDESTPQPIERARFAKPAPLVLLSHDRSAFGLAETAPNAVWLPDPQRVLQAWFPHDTR